MQELKETRLAQVQVLNRARKALTSKRQEASKLLREIDNLADTVCLYKRKIETTNKKIFRLTAEEAENEYIKNIKRAK